MHQITFHCLPVQRGGDCGKICEIYATRFMGHELDLKGKLGNISACAMAVRAVLQS
jgi:hypothetical protein